MIPHILCIFCLLTVVACTSLREYHDELIQASFVSEVPTLIGNCAGSVVGIPFLVISTPIALLQNDGVDLKDEKTPSQYRTPKVDTILFPIKVTSYTGGIILGSPFYWPCGKVFFPKEKIQSDE